MASCCSDREGAKDVEKQKMSFTIPTYACERKMFGTLLVSRKVLADTKMAAALNEKIFSMRDSPPSLNQTNVKLALIEEDQHTFKLYLLWDCKCTTNEIDCFALACDKASDKDVEFCPCHVEMIGFFCNICSIWTEIKTLALDYNVIRIHNPKQMAIEIGKFEEKITCTEQ